MSSLTGEGCYQEEEASTDTLLVSILRPPLGMLKRTLLEMSPKGVRLHGATVYVARLDKEGHLRMARPCPSCMDQLKKLKVKRVIYSTDIGWDSELI